MTLRGQAKRTRGIGIVIPVHNEEDLLQDALTAVGTAVERVPSGIDCRVIIVLDSCSDASESIARRWASGRDAHVVHDHHGNVGAARRSGCSTLLDNWRHKEIQQLWLATTDADSEVPPEWLVAQIGAHEAGADLWTGRVRVSDWSLHRASTMQRWHQEYVGESAPVHGASMGVNAQLYREIGGFRPLETGEDRDLYERAVTAGARVHHDCGTKVVTSARRDARAPLGFSHVLTSIEQGLQTLCPIVEHSTRSPLAQALESAG